MTKWFIHLIVNSVVLLIVAHYVSAFELNSVWAAVIASVILAFFHLIVKPILVILTLPVTILTFGLFLFVINAIILMLTAGVMGDAFNTGGFGTALLAAVIIAVLNLLIDRLIVRSLLHK